MVGAVLKSQVKSPNYFRNGHDYRFEIDSLKVNLKSGSFTIEPGEKDVMQMTCLAFVTATLYLLVQPRPKSVADAKNVNQRGSKRVNNLHLLPQCCHDVYGGNASVWPQNTVRGSKRVRRVRGAVCSAVFSLSFHYQVTLF